MNRIRLPELAKWVLADPITTYEDHAVTFLDLPKDCTGEFLPDGICLALRVFEEANEMLEGRPERARYLYIYLESRTECPSTVPRSRADVERLLDYTPPSIYLRDDGRGFGETPQLIYSETLDLQKVFEGCSLHNHELVAKYALFRVPVRWDPGLEYQHGIVVANAKWLPRDRDLRTAR